MEKYNVKELLYCSSERCEPIGMCVECAIQNLKDSPEGRLLADNPMRYEQFWGGKKSTLEDQGLFRIALGEDVDPLLHGAYQAQNIAIPMIEMQNSDPDKESFSQEEAKLLVLGHVFHDAHEGISGDVAYPDKTQQTYEDELKLNLEVVQKVLRADDEFMDKYRGVVGDLEGWSYAGRAFAAGEYCGYLSTGLKAWSLRNHSSFTLGEQAALETMGRDVTLFILPKVRLHAEEFAYCSYLVNSNAFALAEMYN